MIERLAPAFGPIRPLLLAGAVLLVAACGDKNGGGGDAPKGQVVARLDGTDITQLEVNAELQGMNLPPTVPRREAEKAALNNILTRRLLKGAAEERKINENPQFQLQQRRASEQLYVQALAQDIAAKVAKPASDQVDQYMEENPFLFRERRQFQVDQIQFLQPADLSKLNLPAIKTMAEVEAALTANGIQFRRQPARIDALGANPAFVREIMGVLERNPSELFMFANRVPNAPAPVMLVNQVTRVDVVPFTGDNARQFAERQLQNQRIQTALAAEVEKQRKTAKDRVTFQKGWEIPFDKPAQPAAVAGKTPPGPAGGTATPAPGAAATGTRPPAAAADAPAPTPAG